MKKILTSLILSGLLMASPAVAAKKDSSSDINFGAMKCSEFMSEMQNSSEDDMAAVLLWLDGYLSGVSGDTVLSWKNFESLTMKLIDYCGANGRVKVLDAAKKVGIQ
ncbi:MAG: hypothetical protein G8345_12730 [Magnetococcales bacterium]|nr:hypothetical protein [Magnetococcales bacterium]